MRLRVIIYDDDYRELRRLGKQDHLSIAQQVRRAVHAYIKYRKFFDYQLEILQQEKDERYPRIDGS